MELNFALAGIDEAAGKLLSWLEQQQATVVALTGVMGAGKTTFTAALLRAMGSADIANSPTFSIINQYAGKKGEPVYHLDLYRLRDEEEAIQAGVEDCFYSGYLCIVEWPEKAASILPDSTIFMNLGLNEDGSRTLYSQRAQ